MDKNSNIGATKITRRLLIKSAAAAGSLPVLALYATPAAAKVSQAAVGYQAEPKGDKSCGNCNLFVAPTECKTVEGPVAATGWCKIWVKKAG